MQNKKGFTIIELIVVIAIIAILAAIVMVNVVQYINRSKDASIQANLNTIIVNAQAWAADPVHTMFDKFNLDSTYSVPADAIKKQNGSPEADLNYNILPSMVDNTFCVDSQLASDNSIHWCVDSSGFSGKGACSTDGTCPDCKAICK